MSKGLSTFEVPIANDIGLGECKIYGNYELPDQHIIGATRGGVKATIERAIREMPYDGSYGPTKGLRRYDKFISKVELQALCLKYQVQDTITNMESDTTLWTSQDWGQTGGTYAAETSIVLQGDQSAKMTADTMNYGIHEVWAASKDLTAFSNGETSDTSDYIGFSYYLSAQDITDLSSAHIRLGFHMDALGTETNMYIYDVVAASLSAGWNTFKIAKSAFTEVGSGDWSAVLGVSIKLSAAPGAEVVLYADEITMIQYNAALRSSLFPVNRGGMNVTDETTYYKLLPTLEIASADYYENIAIVGQKLDGKAFILILKNCLNDGAISLGVNEKDEVINSTTFSSHFKRSAKTTVPLKIRDYDV